LLNVRETPAGLHSGALAFSRSLREWSSYGSMTRFLLLVALQPERCSVLGEPARRGLAALSVAAALGVMLVPAAVSLRR